jgi:hypothetical protein
MAQSSQGKEPPGKPGRFKRPADGNPLLAPIALRALAEACVVREAHLVYSSDLSGWLLKIYHASGYHTVRMWDKPEPRVFRDANTAARQAASLGIAELRMDLASVPDPDILTRATRPKPPSARRR